MLLTLGGKTQRLIFYAEDKPYEDSEIIHIQEYKKWAEDVGKPILFCDQEILRNLYARKMVY
jgi:hypothetical protein